MDRPALAAVAAIAGVVACSHREPDRKAPDLAQYLYDLSGTDATAAVDGWLLDRDAWNATVAPPYRALYDDYVLEFTTAKPVFIHMLSQKHPVQSRAHFAGDARMTWSQAVTRWALPTLAPARIAQLTGRPPLPFEAVFVDVGGRWRALAGIGPIVRRKVAALNELCATALDYIEPGGGPCIEAAWAVADTALQNPQGFDHACDLAMNLCGKRSP